MYSEKYNSTKNGKIEKKKKLLQTCENNDIILVEYLYL